MPTSTTDDAAGDGTPTPTAEYEVEHFKPTGTLFVLALFVATLILLWASVFVILLSRGSL